MLLLQNDLIQFNGEFPEIFRVLWISQKSGAGYLYNMGKKDALPEFHNVRKLETEIEAGTVSLLPNDRSRYGRDEDLSEKAKAIRDKAMKIIDYLLLEEPKIYRADRRWELIQNCSEAFGVTEKTIYKYLRRFWERGQSPNALLPDYHRCGSTVERKLTEGISLGRPKKFGTGPAACHITADIKGIFEVGYNRHYRRNAKFNLKDAFQAIKEDFFFEQVVDPETGKEKTVVKEEFVGKLPNDNQFKFWVTKTQNKVATKRDRVGDKNYELNERATLGSNNQHVNGPGARYQIDATIVDVYIVSKDNSGIIIGRPTLYIVIDVFSRMIVGFYLGMESASWVGAMLALASVVRNKKELCAEFGIEIDEDQWECIYLPSSILGDNGEMISVHIDDAGNNFKIRVENAPPYRADWKAVVEKQFHLIHTTLGPYLPGSIQKDFRKRGAKDYRLEATQTLDDLTEQLLHCILEYNNNHLIEDYDMDAEMLAENVPAIPKQLWNWGIRNRTGALRRYPENFVKFSLMPSDTAKVTQSGFKFREKYYTSQRAIAEGWFDRARQDGNWTVRFSYDPRRINKIYIHNPSNPAQYDVAYLTPKSRAHEDLSYAESELFIKAQKDFAADHKLAESLTRADRNAALKKVTARAAARDNPLKNQSDTSRVRDIRPNAAAELARERAENHWDLGAPNDLPADHVAEVIPINRSIPTQNYEEPTMLDMFEDDES